jgi:hypothetical protein
MIERSRNSDAPPPQRVDDESAVLTNESRQNEGEHKGSIKRIPGASLPDDAVYHFRERNTSKRA